MSNIDETLKERGNVYGSYGKALDCKLAIQEAIIIRYEQTNGKAMPMEDLMLFQDVIGKLSRLASSPQHIDSWHDLAGYSLLIEGTLNESK